jgi:hypothetical protein
MNRLITICVTVIALLCTACQRGPKNILLRLHYHKNTYLDITYRTYAVRKENQDEPLRNEIAKMGFTVDSVINDSLYHLSAKFDFVRVKNRSRFKSEEYSSDEDEKQMSTQAKQLHQQFKPVLKSTFNLTINDRGQIVKPFSFRNGVNIPQSFSPIQFEMCQIVFPKEKLALGDDWTNEGKVPLTGGKRITNYQIESIKDEIITIKVSGKVEIDSHSSEDFYGEYLLDEKTKGLISAKITMEIETLFEGKIKEVIDIKGK